MRLPGCALALVSARTSGGGLPTRGLECVGGHYEVLDMRRQHHLSGLTTALFVTAIVLQVYVWATDEE